MQKRPVTMINALKNCYKYFAALTAVLAVAALSSKVFGADQAQQPRKILLASTIGPIDAGIVGVLEAASHR